MKRISEYTVFFCEFIDDDDDDDDDDDGLMKNNTIKFCGLLAVCSMLSNN